jgi:hypothetical protein
VRDFWLVASLAMVVVSVLAFTFYLNVRDMRRLQKKAPPTSCRCNVCHRLALLGFDPVKVGDELAQKPMFAPGTGAIINADSTVGLLIPEPSMAPKAPMVPKVSMPIVNEIKSGPSVPSFKSQEEADAWLEARMTQSMDDLRHRLMDEMKLKAKTQIIKPDLRF